MKAVSHSELPETWKDLVLNSTELAQSEISERMNCLFPQTKCSTFKSAHRTHQTLNEAYLCILEDLLFRSEGLCSPGDQLTSYFLGYQFVVTQPTGDPVETLNPKRNEKLASYLRAEQALYSSMSNRVEDFEKASKFWRKIANPDGTINSAYGYLIWKNPSINGVTPWEFAKRQLVQGGDGILQFLLPEHLEQLKDPTLKDLPCTIAGQFINRNGTLHLSMHMRSNDVVLGLPYDAPWFMSLMDKMIKELKDEGLSLQKGSYCHRVNDLHLYERDRKKALKMIGIR